jgi:hypothetical protein
MAAFFASEGRRVLLTEQRPAIRHPEELRVRESQLMMFEAGALPTHDAWVVKLIEILVALRENDALVWLNEALLVDKREVLRHLLAPTRMHNFGGGKQVEVPSWKLPVRASSVAQWLAGVPPIRELELEVARSGKQIRSALRRHWRRTAT